MGVHLRQNLLIGLVVFMAAGNTANAQQDSREAIQQSSTAQQSPDLEEKNSTSDALVPDSGSSVIERSELAQHHYDLVQQVLEGKDFGEAKEVTSWRLKDWQDETKRASKFPAWVIWLIEAMESNEARMVGVSKGVEFVLWALVIGLLVFLGFHYRSQIKRAVSSLTIKKQSAPLPSSMFGLEIEADSLPEDVVKQAQQCWSNGEVRDGLALLLRASLVKLLHDFDCEFFSSDTESECCDRVAVQAPAAQSAYLRQLVTVWQLLAYAHQAPTHGVFDDLCASWQEVF